MVSLIPLVKNPFSDYPKLLTIWDKRKIVMYHAVEAYLEVPGIEQKFSSLLMTPL